MVFCCHCGKLSEGGRYCTACGRLLASTPATATASVADDRLDAVAAMRAELDRHRKQMRFLVVGLCVVVISVGLIVSWVTHAGPTASHSLSSGENSVPEAPPRQQLPIQVPSGQAIVPGKSAAQTPQKAVQATVPGSGQSAEQSVYRQHRSTTGAESANRNDSAGQAERPVGHSECLVLAAGDGAICGSIGHRPLPRIATGGGQECRISRISAFP